ncbi:MAG: TolC family protein [Phycisphaeraceae bacterium]
MRATNEGNDPPGRQATPEPPDTPETPERAGETWFVSRALAGSWAVRAAVAEVDRKRAEIAVARGLPDPMASVTVGELAETAAGRVDAMFVVQQAFPFPGTLDARGRVAEAGVETARRELVRRIAGVRGDARRAYWSYQEAAAARVVLEQSEGLLGQQIESAVRSRVEVGKAGQDDLLRVSRRRLRVSNEIEQARQRQASAAARLRELMNLPAAAALPEPMDVDWTPPALDRASIDRRVQRDSPGVRVAQGEVQRQRQRLELARIERRPDFRVGAMYAPVADGGLAPSANGEDQIAGTLGVTLPLWRGKYDAAEREAALGVGKAAAEVRGAQQSASAKAADALARLESQQAVLDRLRERMLPEGRQTIDIALAGYRTGRVDVLQLLADWRSLLDDRLAEARVLADLHRARADLAEVLGGPINPERGVVKNDDPLPDDEAEHE